MFKYFLIAFLFLFGLIFLFVYLIYKTDVIEKINAFNEKNKPLAYNNFFSDMNENEVRWAETDILEYYFDGLIFRDFRVVDDAIIHTYNYVAANETIFRDYVKAERMGKLQERIKADIVKYYDRYYSSQFGPGFSYYDFIEVDASIYRRVVVKKVTILK
jgi:hypothetical protein